MCSLHGIDDQTDIEQLVAKALEKLNVRAAADNRDSRARGARRENTPFELSCFWCGGKDHTLFECPDPPPNPKPRQRIPAHVSRLTSYIKAEGSASPFKNSR